MKKAAELFAALVGVATLAAAVEPTFAQDDSRCDELWRERNKIYQSRGYCFKTAKAKRHFSNEGCKHNDEGAVPLTDNDRARIADIQKQERDHDCHH